MKPIRDIFALCRPYKRELIIASLLTGALTLVGLLPPLLMRHLINDVARKQNWGIFELIIGLMLALPVFRAGVNVLTNLFTRKIHLGIIGDTRKALFSHIIHLPLEFHTRTPAGNILQRLMADVVVVSGFITEEIIVLLTDITAILFAIVVMTSLNITLSALTLLLLPLYYINYRLFSHRMKSNTAMMRSHMDHISSSLQERLSAHEVIQSFGQEEQQQRHFTSMVKQLMDASIKGQIYTIAYENLSTLFNKLGDTCIYGIGCYLFLKGRMEYGDVIAFCAYAGQLLGPTVRLAKSAGAFSRVGVSIDRIHQLRAETEGIVSDGQKQLFDAIHDDISLDGVGISFLDDTVLQDLNLKINAGECLAIAGSAGTGRTTMAKLLQRHIEPSKGVIRIDGIDIRNWEPKSYRQRIALVLPESAIFDGSIRENLLYGAPDADDEWMKQVCCELGLNPLVQRLKYGYDTRLGTGGLKLPAGMRQLIGIGRAIIARPTLLISDEATAVLDPVTADRVLEGMRKLMDGKTLILIINRMLIGQHADRIVVLDNGRIAEDGAFQSLLADENSLYRQMFIEQYGEDLLPPEDAS